MSRCLTGTFSGSDCIITTVPSYRTAQKKPKHSDPPFGPGLFPGTANLSSEWPWLSLHLPIFSPNFSLVASDFCATQEVEKRIEGAEIISRGKVCLCKCCVEVPESLKAPGWPWACRMIWDWPQGNRGRDVVETSLLCSSWLPGPWGQEFKLGQPGSWRQGTISSARSHQTPPTLLDDPDSGRLTPCYKSFKWFFWRAAKP